MILIDKFCSLYFTSYVERRKKECRREEHEFFKSGREVGNCVLPRLAEMFKSLIILRRDAIFNSKELYLKDPKGLCVCVKKI